MTSPDATIRTDKWLWHARFFKTRSLAAKVVSGGHLRVNGERVSKPAYVVRVGDVLTFPQARLVRVIKVLALSERRGPATEAQTLYEDLTPEPEPTEGTPQPRRGRPQRDDRRAARDCKRRALE